MMYRFISQSRIARVWEKKRIVGGSSGRVNADGQMVPGVLNYGPDGWWITTEGPSPISMKVGDSKPEDIIVGQEIKIVLEV